MIQWFYFESNAKCKGYIQTTNVLKPLDLQCTYVHKPNADKTTHVLNIQKHMYTKTNIKHKNIQAHTQKNNQRQTHIITHTDT